MRSLPAIWRRSQARERICSSDSVGRPSLDDGVSASLSRGSTEFEMSRTIRPKCCCCCEGSFSEAAAANADTASEANAEMAVEDGLLMAKNVCRSLKVEVLSRTRTGCLDFFFF